MANIVSKRVVLSAINNQLNHLTEAAGFCDFLLEENNRKTNPFLSDDDYITLKNLSSDFYYALDVFAQMISKISDFGTYENTDKSSVED